MSETYPYFPDKMCLRIVSLRDRMRCTWEEISEFFYNENIPKLQAAYYHGKYLIQTS